MKEKPIQYYDPDYIERCKDLSDDQILQFLEDYRKLVGNEPEKCKLISLKIEPSLLKAFKFKADKENVPYQTQIKRLMKSWVTQEP
ncbi:MAG: hypothetical protein KDK62_05675 [Chlamydiia bacterium]|nr:hypothetical protein [Chlamydiia bacterium]